MNELTASERLTAAINILSEVIRDLYHEDRLKEWGGVIESTIRRRYCEGPISRQRGKR